MPEKKTPTISQYFKSVTDPRRENRRHKLIDIITISICAVICNADNYEQNYEFGIAKSKWLKKFLQLPHGNNEKNIDLESLYDYVDKNKLKTYEGIMLPCIGEFLMNFDDDHITEAEDWIKKSIEFHKKNGMRWYLGKDYALYAELVKRKGDPLKAKEKLGKSIEILTDCGADGWVEKYEKELAELS
ncbi:transposase family protein [Thermodesulfobacteriota bacterium]